MKQIRFLRSLKSLVLISGLLCVSTFAVALDIDRFVEEVIDADPIVREKVHVYRKAVEDFEIAKSGWRPRVDLQGSVSHTQSDVLTNNSQSRDYNSNIIELAVTQNLFNGFDTENHMKQAEARINAALYDLLDTIDNTALEAVQAYLEVIHQVKLFELAQINVASHEETLSQIKIRSESGAGRRSEQEQTEGRLARARASLIAQHNNVEDSLTQLHQILGRYMGIDEFIDPVLPEKIDMSMQQAIDKALLEHPAQKVAQSNIEAAKYDHKRSRSAFMPTLDLRLAQEINDNIEDSRDNDDELTLSLNLNYNLYNGGADRAERRKRVSEISQQQQFAARVRRQIMNTLSLAWNADRLLQQQLEYLQLHVVKAEETLASYQEEFYAGERDLIDVLDAKNEVNNAQSNFTSAYYDAAGARYRSYEGMGQLFEALGVSVEVSEGQLRISRIVAAEPEVLVDESRIDFDEDKLFDKFDHCDNSVLNLTVNDFGCAEVKGLPEHSVNTPPQANNDRFDVSMNGVKTISEQLLLLNDSDPDQDALRIVSFTQPKTGQLAHDDAGNLVYRSAEGFFGVDQFSYTVADKNGATSEAQVSISIPDAIALGATQYVNFQYNSIDLTEGSQAIVDRIVGVLRDNPQLNVSLITHTDSKGAKSYNLALSEERAIAIKAALAKSGIADSRIRLQPKGESEPIADNSTEEGRAINRRGEFVFDVAPN